MSELFFQVSKNHVIRGRVSSTGGKVLKWNPQSALLPTEVSQEYVHSWFDPVKMSSVLMCEATPTRIFNQNLGICTQH